MSNINTIIDNLEKRIVDLETSAGITRAKTTPSGQIIHKSRYPDLVVPAVNAAELWLQRMKETDPKKVIFVNAPDGREVTAGQLVQVVPLIASSLQARGLEKGSVLAIFAPNLPEYVVVFMATVLAGGVVTTASPLYTVEEFTRQLVDSKARFVVTIPMFLEKALESAKQATNVKETFVFGEGAGATPFATLMKPVQAFKSVKVDAHNDIAAMPYSSGTTGVAKGVMLTHINLVAQLQELSSQLVPITTSQSVFIDFMPMFHIYAIVAFMFSAPYNGIKVVVMPKFELPDYLSLVQKYKSEYLFIVPPVVVAMAKHPIVEKYDLSHVKGLLSAAAPLEAATEELVRKRLPGLKAVMQAYGMTECTGASHYVPYSAAKAGSGGVLLPNTECRIVDPETLKDCEINKDGELWLRGPTIMKGYFGRDEATHLTLVEDGWLRTGDIGHVDEEGYVFVVDRLKELIKYKGFQVPPAELEALLLTHPAVADVAVIPIPDEEAGELPRAYVVKKSDVKEADLIAFVDQHVAPHKKLRGGVIFIDQIPKSPSGKILRRVLREQAKLELSKK